MHFSSLILSGLSLVGAASAHMIMANPVPYGKSSLNNSPLAADGSDFPCKQRGGVYNAEGANNIYAAGSTQTLSFTGSAVHGGGSCQISVTTDLAPTKDSVWKVIHTIEGGCPARDQTGNLPANPDGSDASKYQFTIPAELAGGKYTLAWTWFNRIGNREMYMNCAPLTVTGGSAKLRRDEGISKRDTAGFLNTLPNMMVANVGAVGNGCTTLDAANFPVQFPNAGSSVEQNLVVNGQTLALKPFTGNCGKSAVVAAAPAPAAAASSAPAAPASPATTMMTSVVAPAANTGGVFVPIATSTAIVSPVPAATSTAAASAAPAPAAASSAPAPAAPAPASSSGTMPAQSACTAEGTWNCLPDGKSYQRCASGMWTGMMPMAAGTACTPGMGELKMVVARDLQKRHGHFHKRHYLAELIS